jgi:hypothetical protein
MITDPIVREALANLTNTYSRMKGIEARGLRIGGTPATEPNPAFNLNQRVAVPTTPLATQEPTP